MKNLDAKSMNQIMLIIIIITVWFGVYNIIVTQNLNNAMKDIDEAQTNAQIAQSNYTELQTNFEQLESNYDVLNTTYSLLEANYTQLCDNYVELQNQYAELQSSYDDITNAIIGYNTDGHKEITKSSGVCYYDGHKETYYNLPMSTIVSIAKKRNIEGNYWVRSDGVKMYGMYVMVAADQSKYPYGSTVKTSVGEGIVLDTGAFINWNSNQFDIAVTW